MDAPIPRDALAGDLFLPRADTPPVEWTVFDGAMEYPAAVALMEQRAALVAGGQAPEAVFLVEHPPLYTAGTSAQASDLLDGARFPVFASGRGGEYTYHGPGQRVAYVILDLKRRRQDVRAFVAALERWVISTLGDFHIKGERREGRVGVWVRRPERPPTIEGETAEDKIAAIGIRIRRWVSFHGISLNVDPDLDHFDGIVPCGIRGHGVTSLTDLGIPVTMLEVDSFLRARFEEVFGATVPVTGQLSGPAADVLNG
ncbi:lipoyl(octanoyl) transferase LipB [Aureimonas sp. ME7]|uniref:lipoyl(octanoyl) transferase LipB n=1 Tax=Aureimonas sp. ME7 TaxID=2744252 RepID=UPI0015F419A3|nr:lipoyl(octanoyl) transferase LipB [Aureimonas sp. ME7]